MFQAFISGLLLVSGTPIVRLEPFIPHLSDCDVKILPQSMHTLWLFFKLYRGGGLEKVRVRPVFSDVSEIHQMAASFL